MTEMTLHLSNLLLKDLDGLVTNIHLNSKMFNHPHHIVHLVIKLPLSLMQHKYHLLLVVEVMMVMIESMVCLGQVLIDLLELDIALFARLVQIRLNKITL